MLRYATHEALEEAEGKAEAEESDSDMSEDEDPLDDDDVAAHGLELVRSAPICPADCLSFWPRVALPSVPLPTQLE